MGSRMWEGRGDRVLHSCVRKGLPWEDVGDPLGKL